MKRFARSCLAFLFAFNLVIFQLAPVAHAEGLVEGGTSEYASEPVDTDSIVDGCYRYRDGVIDYLSNNYVDTSVYWQTWITMDTLISRGNTSVSDLEKNGYIWTGTTSYYVSQWKKDGYFCFAVPDDSYFRVYSFRNGGVVSKFTYSFSQFQYSNIPVFASVDAAVYFCKNKKLQNETDLITTYLPPGYSFNETLGLKLGSSSAKVGSYDESIGYPINFDYKGNLLSMNTARSSTWDFYKDANGNAITRSAEEEKYNIEIFLNFDLKNDYLNNLTNGFTSEFEELQMPARALSYYDGSANSCSCIYENWGITMERAFQYFRDKGSLNMNDFLATNTYYFNTKNLNVWARYYYLDEAGEKHFGDWVKWSKEGLSVVHEDTSSGTESTVEDAVPFGPEYKSSFLEKEQGYDADEQKFTIDGITINVSPYFESQDDDPEYYPTETDSPADDDSGSSSSDSGDSSSSGSGGSGSGIFGTIGELLGNLLAGIVDLITGLLKGLSSAIYKIVKSIKEFFSDISGAGDIFGELFAWLPGEVTVLFTLSIIVAVVCRLMGR